jgi:predicted MFS family arabinose efflux permease
VVLRRLGFSLTELAALGLLQLPWQAKALWATVADHPRVRPHGRVALLGLQLLLALTVAAYGLFHGRGALRPWFALTFLAAFLAATQDVFVDAFAVRTLGPAERGHGNAAQIGGYRVGMILGGGGMLVLSERLSPAVTVGLCGGLIAVAGLGAFALRSDPRASTEEAPQSVAPRGSALALVRDLARRDTWKVAALALTFKLGMHAAGGIVKPLLVDAGWSQGSIGWVAVNLGTGAAVLGSVLGGFLHRPLGDRRGLCLAAVLQALSLLPLLAAWATHFPRGLTAFALASDHLASGVGSTMLFAALMRATRLDRAALHYTLLTSLNALALALGGFLGAGLGQGVGPGPTFTVAVGLCLFPLWFLRGWEAQVEASASDTKR